MTKSLRASLQQSRARLRKKSQRGYRPEEIAEARAAAAQAKAEYEQRKKWLSPTRYSRGAGRRRPRQSRRKIGRSLISNVTKRLPKKI